VFGAYSIGKERVFMAVAEELDAKVRILQLFNDSPLGFLFY
jgi:hypothetical protein